MEQKKILFVDDELTILKALKRGFMRCGHKLYFADSGELALKILAAGEIDLVLSDMRMPGMDGYSLLKKVKEDYPQVIRLILSGYVEESYVYKALIDGSAKTYLAKPWDTNELIELVNALLETEELLKDKKLLNIINTLDHLPTLPEIYHQLMNLIEQDADFEKIVKVIEQDPAISAKVLQVANSAFFKSHTSSLKRAAVFIGLMTLKDVVVGSAVFASFEVPAIGCFNPELIWEHALVTGRWFGELYELLHDSKPPEDVASIGLLHNVGLLLLLQTFPDKFSRLVEEIAANPETDSLVLENEIFGVDHAQLGAYLLNWWNMPYPMIEAALNHNKPLAVPSLNRNNLVILHLADGLARLECGFDTPLRPAPAIVAAAKLPLAVYHHAIERGLAPEAIRPYFVNLPELENS